MSIRRRWPIRAEVVEKSRGLEIDEVVVIICCREGRRMELLTRGDEDEGLVLAALLLLQLRRERPLNARVSNAGEDKDGEGDVVFLGVAILVVDKLVTRRTVVKALVVSTW